MENFGKNLKIIRLKNKLKQADIEGLMGIKQTTWNNYELGKSFPKLEDLVKISKYFDISESDLIHSKLFEVDIVLSKADKLGALIDKANKFVPKNVLDLAQKNSEITAPKIAPNIAPNSISNSQTEVVYEGRQNIIMVNHKVAAGFALIVHNSEQLQALPRFTVPQLAHKMGTFYCFPVSGDSMHPTVKHKEWVIVEQREGISDIKGGHVYMICTHEGLCLKRLYYKTGEKHIKCVSDNETYVPYNEDVVNVLGIYEAIIHFSDDFRNWNNDVRTSLNTAIERITALEQKVFGKK